MTGDRNRVAEQIVDDYLGNLERAADRLPAEQRAELVLQIREHVDSACERDGYSQASVRTILERLGEPSEIVRAAEQEDPLNQPSHLSQLPQPLPQGVVAPTAQSPWGVLEVMAVVLLIVGGFVAPVVGPLAGVFCAWMSPRWTVGEKVVASLLIAPMVLLTLSLLLAFL
ncbi:MAG TPA: hypothetical protein VMT88_05085 [Actinomycetes bacterium]|nr:hypothetical protein [Actinomycetes bacterium]